MDVQERAGDAPTGDTGGSAPEISPPLAADAKTSPASPPAVPVPAPVYVPPAGCAYESLIRSYFPEDGDWMVAKAMSESGCNPCAFYPSRSDCGAVTSSAKGLFQLLGHDGLIADICGDVALWSDPVCNTRVARALYDSAGRRPWGG